MARVPRGEIETRDVLPLVHNNRIATIILEGLHGNQQARSHPDAPWWPAQRSRSLIAPEGASGLLARAARLDACGARLPTATGRGRAPAARRPTAARRALRAGATAPRGARCRASASRLLTRSAGSKRSCADGGGRWRRFLTSSGGCDCARRCVALPLPRPRAAPRGGRGQGCDPSARPAPPSNRPPRLSCAPLRTGTITYTRHTLNTRMRAPTHVRRRST